MKPLKPVFLIGVNLVLEQRWPLLVLMAYVILLTGVAVFSSGTTASDVVELTRMLAAYGVLVGAMMASAIVHHDRRTRRILSVLSKGVTRAQYLAGAVTGIMMGLVVYSALVAAGMSWAAARAGLDWFAVWRFMAFVVSAYLLAVVTPLFFATFLHPMVAMGVALLGLAGLAVAPAAVRVIAPVDAAVRTMAQFSFSGGDLPWSVAAAMVLNSLVLWAAATVVFSRRDIAVAVE